MCHRLPPRRRRPLRRSLQGGPVVQPLEYPVKFSVDYPDRDLNRLTTFFRIFTAIPILIIIGLLSQTSFGGESGTSYVYGSGALVVLPTVLMILFRQKYPRWW